MLKKSQVSYTVNVCVKEIDKITHKIYNEVKGSNRATRNALYGIVKFLNGEFNPSISDYINSVNKFIPRYIALGKGSKIVTVNDSSLSSEFLVSGKPYRVRINDSEIVNNRNNPYMKLITKTYISDDFFDNNTFTELGLFSTDKSQSCWARVVMDKPFRKLDTTVLEITWEITIISPSGEDDYKMDYVKTIKTAETDITELSLQDGIKSSRIDVSNYDSFEFTNSDVPPISYDLLMYPTIGGTEQGEISIKNIFSQHKLVDVSTYDSIKLKFVGVSGTIYYKLLADLPEEDSYSYSLYIGSTETLNVDNDIILPENDENLPKINVENYSQFLGTSTGGSIGRAMATSLFLYDENEEEIDNVLIADDDEEERLVFIPIDISEAASIKLVNYSATYTLSYNLHLDDPARITDNALTYTKHDYAGAPIGVPHIFEIDIDDETGELKINDVTIINEY